jgi:lysophospholipase L1-like esterase
MQGGTMQVARSCSLFTVALRSGVMLLATCRALPAEPAQVTSGVSERGTTSVSESVRWIGRFDARSPNAPAFSWSYSGFAVHFRGTALRATLTNTMGFYFVVLLDGQLIRRFETRPGTGSYTLASDLPEGEHVLEVHRDSEGQYGTSTLLGFSGGTILPPLPGPDRLIEIVGDSVSCGYGNLAVEHHQPELGDGCSYSFLTESAFASYGAIAARALAADLSIVATSGWGVSRGKDHTRQKTIPRVYERALADQPRPAWEFRREPDVVIVNLGANDVTPPAPDPGEAQFLSSYRRLLQTIRSHYAHAWIICAVSASLSDNYPPDIHARSLIRGWTLGLVRERAAQGDQRISHLEFPQSDTSTTGCNWHPSRAAHLEMAEPLTREIRNTLGW